MHQYDSTQYCNTETVFSRAPSVSCATRLKLSICLFIYFFYPGISSEPLNLSQQKFARWRQLVRNRTWGFHFLNFWGGLGWGPKMSLFARICPEWPSQNTIYGAKTENDIKNRKLSCSGRIISLPNGENRAKIGQGTAEILWRIYTKFRFFSAIFRVSSTLKLCNFYTVQIRIQIQIKSYSALSYRGGRECITLSKCQMKQMSLESAAESRMVIDGA